MLASNRFALLFFSFQLTKFIDSSLQLLKTETYPINEIDFDSNKDTLAFVHIQKTSGTFWIDKIKINLLALNNKNSWKNVCKYDERRRFYDCLFYSKIDFGRYSSLYWSLNEIFDCDIHANIGELRRCIQADFRNQGKLNLITILRDPLERYISEFKHVQRGARWSKSVRHCKEMPVYTKTCFDSHSNCSNVTWEEFLSCDYNQANNRQVRMLADYFEIGCESLKCWTKDSNCKKEIQRTYDMKILENAKKNLRSLSFFGLTEYQALSQYLFEKTFKKKLKFSNNLSVDSVERRLSKNLLKTEYKNYQNEIIEKNTLDIALYEYAEKLFFSRVSYFRTLNVDN